MTYAPEGFLFANSLLHLLGLLVANIFTALQFYRRAYNFFQVVSTLIVFFVDTACVA